MASKGRPHTVGKLMTSAFTWAGCGRTDGSGVGVNYQKNWFASNDLDSGICGRTYNRDTLLGVRIYLHTLHRTPPSGPKPIPTYP